MKKIINGKGYDTQPIEDPGQSASDLYDGGWRSSDRDELIVEYKLTNDEADVICKYMEELEHLRVTVKTDDGREIDFDSAVEIMDNDIRDEIADSLDYTVPQAFFTAYCNAHLEFYGEEFEPNKKNGQW